MKFLKQITLKTYCLILFTSALSGCGSASSRDTDLANENPTDFVPGGNSWVVEEGRNIIVSHDDKEGSITWNEEGTVRCWIKTSQTGTLKATFHFKENTADCNLDLKIDDQLQNLHKSGSLANSQVFTLTDTGYKSMDIRVSEISEKAVVLSKITFSGTALAGDVAFSHDDYYWSRRGPSVHLGYTIPEEAGDVTYFYNEINVPKNNDVVGSYFMANGFGEGYFGIQVNSDEERRVLFSVWSPFKTDNPGEIPEDQKIKLLKKGDEVNTGEFGNEGSGGQSFRRYMWKAGVDYRFLLKVKPVGTDKTDYTAYFFAPEIGEWQLVASFRRPKLATHLTRPHSFLENFIPNQGNLTRMAYYSNQWVCNTKGQWFEMTEARFTADNTARKKNRMDYAGGVENATFFMKNCGFFNENTEINSMHQRPATNRKPEIDFTSLP